MLDVHTPEHRITGLRDFMSHMLVVMVGLLLALALENAAEALHHHHQREVAEENIRGELRQNRQALLDAASKVQDERKNLVAVIGLLESRSTGAALPKSRMDVSFEEDPIPDAAWRTASASGVLAYMNYEETERFAEAYKQQDMLQTAEEQALDDYLQFSPVMELHRGESSFENLTPEQARDVLPAARRALAHVIGMLAIGRGTLHSYDEALK